MKWSWFRSSSEPGKTDDPPLFHWLVRRQPGKTEEELLLAPIGYKHGDKPRLYDWVGKKSLRRFEQEEKRLLYVACSRAIQELHLFATIELKQNGELSRPKKNTSAGSRMGGLERRIAMAAQPVPTSNVLTMPSTSAASLLSGNGVVASLAATAEQRQVLHRLPAAWFADSVQAARLPYAASAPSSDAEDAGIASRLARIQGIVLHALLERAATGASGDHPDGNISPTHCCDSTG